MQDIIQVKNLTKKYGDFTAVDNISFSVHQGEAFGILGPNGAGKTTTLEMLEGLKEITSGEAFLDNIDVEKNTMDVKQIIGVQLQASSFFDNLNLKELLVMFAALYERSIDPMDLLKDVELVDKAKKTIRELSGGQKQRFSIAAGLVNDPKVLFLDEPTTGLDPQARRHLWNLITEIKKKGKTVVITTHYMEEAEVLCDRIAIMDHAKIVALDTPHNLLKQSGVIANITFRLNELCPEQHFSELIGVEKVTQDHNVYKLITKDPEKTLSALFDHNTKCNRKIFDLQLNQATLEDVFLKLTGNKLRD